MAAPAPGRLSPEEYLAQERQAEWKSEFYRGEVFAMVGAGEVHVLIAGQPRAGAWQPASRPFLPRFMPSACE